MGKIQKSPNLAVQRKSMGTYKHPKPLIKGNMPGKVTKTKVPSR